MIEYLFRAWDEGNEVMHYDFQFIQSGGSGCNWICFTSDKEPYDTTSTSGICFFNPYFRQQLKVMLATPYLDKVGKRVYAGDIVRDVDGTCYTVDFDGVSFLLGGRILGVGTVQGVTIIGNIYENEELLREVCV